MTKMTSRRFNINCIHGNDITRRPFLYTQEVRGKEGLKEGKEGKQSKLGRK